MELNTESQKIVLSDHEEADTGLCLWDNVYMLLMLFKTMQQVHSD